MTNVYTGPKEINGTRWCPSCSRHMPDVAAVVRGGRTLYRCESCRNRASPQQLAKRKRAIVSSLT